MKKFIFVIFLNLNNLQNVSTSKNVEILADNPPILIGINDTFSWLKYKNSVKIQNLTNIREIRLYARHLLFDSDRGKVSRNLDRTSNDSKIVEERSYRDRGEALTKLSTCKKYEELELSFVSDSENVTVYRFEYDPFTLIRKSIDDWICIVNETVVKVTMKNYASHLECIKVLDLSSYSFHQLKNGYNNVGYVKELKLEMKFHESDAYSLIPLKPCTERSNGEEFIHNLFFIVSMIIIGIIFSTLVFAIIIYKRKQKMTTVKIDGKSVKKNRVMTVPEFSLHSEAERSGNSENRIDNL